MTTVTDANTTAYPPVPYDPELVPGLEKFLSTVEATPLTGATIIDNREHFARLIPTLKQQIAGHPVTAEELSIPGPDGAPEVAITLIRPKAPASAPVPGVLSIHGGGMILGNRHFGTTEIIDYAERFGMVGISVEYRLAPDASGPAQGEDCYAALLWLAANAARLGVDPERLLVTGASAGGGLSAIVSLMARDRKGPKIAGQLLNCPMLDDRNQTVSSYQYDGIGAWDRNNNDAAWDAICGADRGTDRVSPYTAAARASDLSNLPPAYIDVGAAETFRDEAVEYATRIWATGGQAELHVWAGGYHNFAGFSPKALVSQASTAARDSWLRRILGVS